jgi:predicted molibdopterin-dependent oxidoreductase YjgC
MEINLTVDGTHRESKPDERLIDLINRIGSKVPQVCYHQQLGPIQTCDTCMVVDGKLVRACAMPVAPGMNVSTTSARAVAAQGEAFDRILGNHMLYCTVCDNNNGNCTERRIQRLYEVFEPLEGSRPDWRIIQEIANRLGANWNFKHPSEIYAEIASLTPLFAGVTYERLEGYKSLQWPVAADGTDQPLLYAKGFNFPDGKARLFPLTYSEPSDQVNDEFDLHLNNGRLLEHFHEGNLTYRSAGIREQTPDYLRGSLTRTRDRAPDQDRRLGPTGFALWPGPGPGVGDR